MEPAEQTQECGHTGKVSFSALYALSFYVFIYFLEREEKRERNINVERETLIRCLLYATPLPRDLVRNPGLCTDQKSNL